MCLKRWYSALAAVVFAMTISAAAMTFSVNTEGYNIEFISKILLIGALIGFILLAVMRPKEKQTAVLTGYRESVPEEVRRRCTFSDVAANDVALKSLMQLKDYLMEPEKYARYGARMPRGILLYGPPGTGKTLLARALAGEADVPFFAMSGSDFVEKYVGVGAGRVRELFKKARKVGKCVIFIDEIDAMGKARHEQSSDERDQTLNALLSEMSGFHEREGVLVIAATNRIEMLDPALLRPGRFDRQIEVGLPGRRERLSILKLHTKRKPVSEDVNLDRLAMQTTMFSGASLENLINEAAISAASRDGGEIENADIEKAFYRIVAGEDREMAAGNSEKCVIALHEAGHALVSRILMPKSNLMRVSILPAGNGAAGYNLCIPEERVMVGKTTLEAQICVLLAGRAAEVLIGGEDALTTGASGDINRATEIASSMVMELGMGGEPAVSLKVLQSKMGVQGSADKCKKILNDMYCRTCDVLSENISALMAITEALLEQETLSGDEIDRLIDEMSNEVQETA